MEQNIKYQILHGLTVMPPWCHLSSLATLTGIEITELDAHTDDLIMDGTVVTKVVGDSVKIKITPEGKASLGKLINAKDIQENPFDFRWEALTGCNDLGKQSTMDRAALPTSRRMKSLTNWVEDDYIRAIDYRASLRKVAAEYGLSDQEAAIHAEGPSKYGWIKKCTWCGQMGMHQYVSKKKGTLRECCKSCLQKKNRERARRKRGRN
jgi:hypothetical protein